MLLSTSVLGGQFVPCFCAASTVGARRLLSSAPERVLDDTTSASLDLQQGRLGLLTLAERSWGANHILSKSTIDSSAGKSDYQKVAVLREAFAAFNAPTKPLHQLVRSISDNAVAVSSGATDEVGRIVVDEYHRGPDGHFHLQTVATDLLRYLARQDVRTTIAPELSAAHTHNSASSAASSGPRQSTNEVLMVAPTAFGFNEQAAQDNSFMHSAPPPGEEASSLTRQVLAEFAGLHHQLTEVAGVKVNLFQHSLAHGTPDAVFPNNWFSTHPAGEAAGGVQQSTLVLYPMKCPNRAAERRPEIIDVLRSRGYGAVYDMAPEEAQRRYFEGTGVLVLDRINGVAYVDISERADAVLAQQWVERMGYNRLVAFRSSDLRGKAVYHTNVMMAVGTDVAIVCAESVRDPRERKNLMEALRKTHEVVDISLQQMDALCGNALELEDGRGLPVMAMSTQAYNAFTPEQRVVIRRHCADIVHAPIDTLESVGGGGVRCSLAELF